jgi:hypothetical protein
MADSLALRRFVGIGLDEQTPDHSTISRTRRLIDVETHKEVFSWVLNPLADRGLLPGAAAGHRCDDAGGERGDALDRAAGDGGELRGVLAEAGEGLGPEDADAGAVGAVGSKTQEADVERDI